MLGVERHDDQTATRRVLKHALAAEQRQRLLDRLARNAERLRDLLLDDSIAGRELT